MPFLPLYENFSFIFRLEFNPFVFLSLFGFLMNLGILYLILTRAPRNSLTIFYGILVSGLTIWSFSECMIRISHDSETAVFWQSIGAPGWISMGVLFFSFVLLYVERGPILENILAQFLLFGPIPLFLFLEWNTDLLFSKNFVKVPWGWGAPPGVLFPILVLWLETFFVLGLIILIRATLKTADKKKKMQGIFMISGVCIALLFGTITDALLPFLGNTRIPSTAVFFIAIMNLFFAFAIIKYKLFVVSPSVALSSIVATMNEALIVFNPDGFIEIVNPASSTLLGYRQDELIGSHIKKLFPTGFVWDTFWREGLVSLIKGKQVKQFETMFLTKEGRLAPVQLSASPIRSPSGEIVGAVGVAADISAKKELLERLEASSDELKLKKYELERKIGEMLRSY